MLESWMYRTNAIRIIFLSDHYFNLDSYNYARLMQWGQYSMGSNNNHWYQFLLFCLKILNICGSSHQLLAYACNSMLKQWRPRQSHPPACVNYVPSQLRPKSSWRRFFYNYALMQSKFYSFWALLFRLCHCPQRYLAEWFSIIFI